jgi:CRISPR-associated protein Cas2
MMVLITYDVAVTTEKGAKRLRKVAKVCQNYGQRVQNSVFECVITEAQFVYLRSQIEGVIDFDNDSVRFYFLGKNWPKRIEMIGKVTSYNVLGELII